MARIHRDSFRVAVFAAGMGCLACLSAPARADERQLAALVYAVDDPSGTCASEIELRRKVATRLGYDPFEARAPWIFRVHIDGRRRRPRAEIVTERAGRPTGKRELDETSCEALSETVATTIAIAIDPVAEARAAEEPAPAPEPPSAPAPIPIEPPVRSSTVAPARAAPEHAFPLVYLDATATIGRTAGVALGGRGGVGLGYRGVSIVGEVRGEATPDAVTLTPQDSAYWSVFSGALVACGRLALFEMCGVGALGSLQAKARDVDRPSLEGTLFASLGARAGVRFPLMAEIALRSNVELDMPLVRTTFTIDGRPAWTAPAVHAGVGIGLEARFR